MLKNNYKKYIDFAHILADASGEILRAGFKSSYNIEQKYDSSPVTDIDRMVEQCIRLLIEEKLPEHGIIGEEFGNIRTESDYQWVIDPIDGTKAFIAGQTSFTTLIALLHNNRPIIGIIDQPIRRERWAAVTGQQTLYNNIPLEKLVTNKTLKMSSLSTTSTEYFTEEEKIKFTELRSETQNTVLGGDAYAYAMLASGNLEIVLDSGMKPYDFCALSPIIEGVGGVITDWAGKPLTLQSDGSVIAAASRQLYEEVMTFL